MSSDTSSSPRLCPVPVVGVTGGIGSGKSSVSRWVAERYPVLLVDADRLGHAALTVPQIQEQLHAAFGAEIFGASGDIDRRRLAQLVFGDDPERQAARRRLEQIVHPEIRRGMEQQLAMVDPNIHCGVVLDAALLQEAGWGSACDAVVFIDAPVEQRMKRVQEQRGWTPEELAARERSQWPPERKRSEATHTIFNGGPLETAGRELWEILSDLNAPST
ncbi:MAG: dephospho-CoA kinase [Planctomycetaceae bacterium]|nr:dephospho-CoA kinase [Planctomycetaceae bacterium]